MSLATAPTRPETTTVVRPRIAISGRLAQARARHGIPVAAAAAALGVAPVTVVIWEAGLEPPPGAGAVIEAWLRDLESGRTSTPRVVPQYALCEERRRATASLATLRREIHAVHRWLFTANEDNDEQLMLVSETLRAALDPTATTDTRGSVPAVVRTRLDAVEQRLAEMVRRVDYLRALSESALEAAGAAGLEAA